MPATALARTSPKSPSQTCQQPRSCRRQPRHMASAKTAWRPGSAHTLEQLNLHLKWDTIDQVEVAVLAAEGSACTTRRHFCGFVGRMPVAVLVAVPVAVLVIAVGRVRRAALGLPSQYRCQLRVVLAFLLRTTHTVAATHCTAADRNERTSGLNRNRATSPRCMVCTTSSHTGITNFFPSRSSKGPKQSERWEGPNCSITPGVWREQGGRDPAVASACRCASCACRPAPRRRRRGGRRSAGAPAQRDANTRLHTWTGSTRPHHPATGTNLVAHAGRRVHRAAFAHHGLASRRCHANSSGCNTSRDAIQSTLLGMLSFNTLGMQSDGSRMLVGER